MTKRRATREVSEALRRRAEREAEELPKLQAPASPEASARLVHELRVHQIELELQNEELLSTRADLEAALQRYTELYDEAPIGYLTLGANGDLRELNLEAARLLGAPRASLIGRPLVGHLADASRALFGVFCAELRAGPATCVVRPARGEVELRLRGGPATSDADLRVVVDDVTLLNRTALERARLALVVEQLEEAVGITDTEGRLVFVNRAFERLTGRPSAEWLGRMLPLFQDHEAVRAAVRRGETWHGRLTSRRADGATFVEDVALTPLRDESGLVSRFVSVSRDVTEQLHLTEQLHAARRMEAIGKLAGGVAHDFNNLLQIILGSTNFLLEDAPKTGPMRDDLLAIARASDRAVTLTKQLLAFGRRQQLRPEVVDLGELMARVTTMLRRVLREDIRVRIELPRSGGKVFADPSQLEQVVVNLTLNAQDAMPNGGELSFEIGQVAVGESDAAEVSAGDWVTLTVRDNGCGMTEDVRARVFEPFFTTKRDKGTGLGLATVYGIVKQSGGHVTCASSPGSGATFVVYLPRRDVAPIETAAAVAPRLDGRLTGKILLVEDEAGVRSVTRRLLLAGGHEVVVASNGVEALAICRSDPTFALVLSDVIMPRMGGVELRRQLSAEFPALAVLLMSGYPEQLEGLEILTKPFDAPALLAKVDEQLRRQRAKVADAR